MLGNRLKLIRQAHALSLQDLSDQLAADTGTVLHRSAISGYETGRTVPNASVLQALSQVLSVPVEFFSIDDWNDFSATYFYRNITVPQRQQESDAFIQVRLERHRILNQLLRKQSPWVRPDIQLIHPDEYDKIEQLTDRLRHEWNLGILPIPSVCSLLESIGWYLFMTPNNLNRVELNDTEVCGYENSCHMPFILYKSDGFPDELRYNLLKYLGYAYLRGENEEETSRITSRFASALLFSREQALMDVGEKREKINNAELILLKQKYGVPRRFIMRRLYELNIISLESYIRFTSYVRQNLFLHRENLMESLYSAETPVAFDMQLQRALAENLIPENLMPLFQLESLNF